MRGERVVVWDYDTGSEHELVFKKWHTSKSFVLVDNWVTRFVRRRELRDGVEIGLFWDASNSRFGFLVLARRVELQFHGSADVNKKDGIFNYRRKYLPIQQISGMEQPGFLFQQAS
ncbi:B3 domain-containing protein [Camellia lanceoleosa]|uniref:B3 domain-containing protein n=1 Tax=Camellia lanceoleosa TaxID=1840588 RepID=A0ACC0GW98_9ERIC|nr:B3 domain-containing protein [Camellia lanceoleosa]